jgi:hypothetical protein
MTTKIMIYHDQMMVGNRKQWALDEKMRWFTTF